MLLASVVPDSLRYWRLLPTRLLCPWDSPGKNTGVDCCTLLPGLSPIQGSNPRLLRLLCYQAGLFIYLFFTTRATCEALGCSLYSHDCNDSLGQRPLVPLLTRCEETLETHGEPISSRQRSQALILLFRRLKL